MFGGNPFGGCTATGHEQLSAPTRRFAAAEPAVVGCCGQCGGERTTEALLSQFGFYSTISAPHPKRDGPSNVFLDI